MANTYQFNTDSDTEVMLVHIADAIFGAPGQHAHAAGTENSKVDHLRPQAVFEAIRSFMYEAKGGYASLLQLTGKGIVAFRDPNGIRPICYGQRRAKNGWDYMVASESSALNGCGFELVRNFRPGEAIWFGVDGTVLNAICHVNPVFTPCLFEWVYFARPDSVIDGVSVYQSRQRMGDFLAEKLKRDYPDIVKTIDVVCPVPDTSRVSAVHCAITLGARYEEGLSKNRYIARTFIMPGQAKRRSSVRKKLAPIPYVLENKTVLLIDDSIVRGTTSSEIIQMCRDAGARRVIFCSAAPPIRYPNVYGIDIPIQSELVAYGRNEEEISKELGADLVVYGDTDDVVKCVTSLTDSFNDMDTSCFTGRYVTGKVDTDLLNRLMEERSDANLVKKLDHVDIMDGGMTAGPTSAMPREPSYHVGVEPVVLEDSELEDENSFMRVGQSAVIVNQEKFPPHLAVKAGGKKIANMNRDFQVVADTLSGW